MLTHAGTINVVQGLTQIAEKEPQSVCSERGTERETHNRQDRHNDPESPPDRLHFPDLECGKEIESGEGPIA